MLMGGKRHCWLRLKKHSFVRSGQFGQVHDGISPRIWTVEWATCSECGYTTTLHHSVYKYK